MHAFCNLVLLYVCDGTFYNVNFKYKAFRLKHSILSLNAFVLFLNCQSPTSCLLGILNSPVFHYVRDEMAKQRFLNQVRLMRLIWEILSSSFGK